MLPWIRHHSRSIVTRMALFGVFVVAVGFFLRMLVLLPHVKEQSFDLSARHQLTIAQYVANDINAKLAMRLDFLERLGHTLPQRLLTDPAGLEDWLKTRLELTEFFPAGIVVLRPNGDGAFADYPPLPWRRKQDFSRNDLLADIHKTHKPAIGKPLRESGSDEPVLVMAAPVLDHHGQLVAVLTGITPIAAPHFLDLMQETKIGKTGGFLLISPKDNLFVAASDPAKVLAPLPAPGVNALHDRAMAGLRGTGITINIRGVEELSAMVSVPVSGWFLVARLPTDEIMETVNDTRIFIVRWSAFVAVLVIVLVAVSMRSFFRPLVAASAQLHKMARGETALAPLPVPYDNEMGDLAKGFNFLLDRLREKDQALQDSENRMLHQSRHDPLTGLPNRALFEERLEQLMAQAERSGATFAVLHLDLDDFKPVNTAHGHVTGDTALCQIAQRLSRLVRKGDTVARIGGDEFAILMPTTSNAMVEAEIVADKCMGVINAPIHANGTILTLTASVGIACFPDDGKQADRLLSHADRRMAQGKRAKTPS